MNRGFQLVELAIIAAVIGVIAAIAIPNLLQACSTEGAKYKEGEWVQIKLTKQRGQVVRSYARGNGEFSYDVRVSIVTTDEYNPLLGGKVRKVVRAYSIVHFRDFELEPCDTSNRSEDG